jgi:D-beta-D-heptose 7-phosphate kinase/D-beta-D-heptose 1-phosphate adenosyltransferase
LYNLLSSGIGRFLMLLNQLKSLIGVADVHPKILVIGDLMIDHYIFGQSSRLSPEAPVPILLVQRETSTLGGAANVAQNLIAYQAKVSVCGIVGNDDSGKKLLKMLKDEAIDSGCTYIDAKRVTTQKTRVIAGNHHITRIDHEVTSPLTDLLAKEIFENIKLHIESSDIILLSDYNKGLLTPFFVQQIIQYANSVNKRVLIDPKGSDYSKYKGAYIIKPNRKELAEAAQIDKIFDRERLEYAAYKVIALTDAQYLIVTLSEEGIAIFGRDKKSRYFPVKAKEVFDVTGAGDTVIATLANFLALGFSIEDACELANHAAAIVVKHIGSAVVSQKELIEHVEKNED